jgi:Lectin C-type domain
MESSVRIACTTCVARLIALVGLIGCFSPRAPEGAPCASSDRCPPPQACVAGFCRLADDHEPDATPAPDVSADAAVDTAVDAVMLPCTVDGLTCNGATPHVFMCGSSCFASCGMGVVAATARNVCAAWSGRLAEIHDAATDACVAAKIGQFAWVGLTQASTATTPDADWSWNNTTPLTYTNWRAGKPDDAGGGENGQEQCALMFNDGTWDDTGCGAIASPFICGR